MRGWHVTRRGPATIQPDPAEEFSLENVTWAVLPGLYEQLEAERGFSDGQLRSSRR